MSGQFSLFQSNPAPIAVIATGKDGRMARINVGDSIETIRNGFSAPRAKTTLKEWGALSGNLDVWLFAAGREFKGPTALVFSEGKLAVIGGYEET